ncbi:thiol oxidoreductase [Nitrosomonas sp. PY1]|nr:thiol oxidoreductase [Nitrosomonas sp. PY1]
MPNPIESINSMDLGSETQISAELDDGTMLYVALTAYNQDGESAFSNIEVIAINNELSGGSTTIFNESSSAFSNPAPNLSPEGLSRHLAGDSEFEQSFVTAPALINAGLGPAFNSNSCISCHPKDGRGRPPEEGGISNSFFLRVSLPGVDSKTGGSLAVPGFGTQLFDKAVFGVQPEATVKTTYTEVNGKFGDETPYQLRKPTFTITDPYIDLPSVYLISPRVAPPVFGRGLLEAISDETLLGWADEHDLNNDGISGRVNRVWDVVTQTTVIGRFGLKANNPSVLVQNAGAYHSDMGITNELFPIESTVGQTQNNSANDGPELKPGVLDDVTFYIQTLAVPARRNINDPVVKKGQILFDQAGCAACHIPTVTTGVVDGVPEISNQIVHPYTDLLLHDMGERLADDRNDFIANGQEWRTPPLWGIGYTEVVNGHTFFLHDGRARNLTEAILWHGGEAESSKEYFRVLSSSDRDALIKFLESL